jgi:hypothetical protein
MNCYAWKPMAQSQTHRLYISTYNVSMSSSAQRRASLPSEGKQMNVFLKSPWSPKMRHLLPSTLDRAFSTAASSTS